MPHLIYVSLLPTLAISLPPPLPVQWGQIIVARFLLKIHVHHTSLQPFVSFHIPGTQIVIHKFIPHFVVFCSTQGVGKILFFPSEDISNIYNFS